jgi:hypothetical protein
MYIVADILRIFNATTQKNTMLDTTRLAAGFVF